jgi:hypothetical protein
MAVDACCLCIASLLLVVQTGVLHAMLLDLPTSVVSQPQLVGLQDGADCAVLCAGVVQVMLYDDEQGDCITPDDVFERLDDDLAVAGAVVWVGISFEQSASTEYFRKVSAGLLCWCPTGMLLLAAISSSRCGYHKHALNIGQTTSYPPAADAVAQDGHGICRAAGYCAIVLCANEQHARVC